MKRIIFDYLTLEEAKNLSEQVETLVMENDYCKVLDLFDGESYWVKGNDIEGIEKGSKHNLSMLLKVSIKDGKTMVDNMPLESLCCGLEILTKKSLDDFTADDRNTWVKYVCLTMLNLKIAQDKDIRLSENKSEKGIKPSTYRYNPNKPVLIDNVVYAKKAPQGRGYHKQADNWLVRAHYRVRNGVKYLVKGYEKTFKK